MPQEWPISLECNAEVGGMDLVDEKYERAIYLESVYDASGLDIDCTYDRAVGLNATAAEPQLDATLYCDWAIALDATVGQDLALDVGLFRFLAFSLDSEATEPQLIVDASCDRGDALNATASTPELNLEIAADRADKLDSSLGKDFGVDITLFMRSILDYPPDGVLTLLGSSASSDGEIPFDKCVLDRGVTAIVQLECRGARLDDYLIEFFVRLAPGAIPVIHKSSHSSKGGIRLQGITADATEKGVAQEAIAQIVLDPEDTLIFDGTRVVFYECRASIEGMGESYRLAPVRERGESGTITISAS